jgi:O-antigen/teichoic acid export membrane protein
LTIPFFVLVGIGVSTAKAFNDATTHVAVRQLFIPISRAIIVPGVIALGFGAVYATAGIAVTMILGGLLALLLGFRHIPFDLRGPREPMLREMLTFSVPLMLASGMQFLITNTDTILVGAFLATTSVGVYNAALRIMNLGWLFFYPVTTLLGPVLTRLDREYRIVEATRTYQVSVKWMALLTIPMFLLLFLFPQVVIGVTFGEEATSGAAALRILILPVMFSVLLGPNDGALVSFGHNKIHMYGNAATALANLGLNLFLIPRYGIVGAATATALSLGMRNVIYSARLYQAHGVQPFSGALFRVLGATVPIVAVGYFAFVRLFPVRFLTVTAIGLVFLTVYVIVVVKVGGIEQEDIDVVTRFEESKGLNLDILRTIVKRLQA